MSSPSRDHGIGVAAVLFSSVVWGTTGTAATFAPEVGPAAIGAAAMGVGGLLQALLAGGRIARALPELARHWRNLLLGGLAVAIYPLAFYASMRLAGVTIGTVVTIGSAPLLSALIEWLFDGARLSRRWLAGASIGLLGMVLLCLAEDAGHQAGEGATLLGIALGLVGGLTYALYSWTARRLMLRGIHSRVAMGTTFGIGGLLLMPVLVATGGPFLASWGNAAVGIYMALVPMFLGYVCFGIGLARISASMATTITLIEPVMAAMLAILVVGERLPALGWIGVVLVVSCLVVITVPVKLKMRPVRTVQKA
ncbi:EamA family transporter (plasmid) [Paracoccus versutus]|uniref:DME family drug/metabolite transporter n=2 Tax=Paracoccus TaxID=265 RepID=A0AAQ0HH62_PARVE|nr:EamA family transporter [Paracoccus versutus]KGJ10422.1 membrane protein [Paracoccus versutus]REG46652.1 DME family drug/metabolite transporter [Paracoccus versutus]WEJ80910.1 EamA family transporter [Paracoccus versutus]